MIRALRQWQGKPLDRDRARAALLVNQLATPGLGSLMAGRWLVGAGQLLLACAGFGLFAGWLVHVLVAYYSLMFSAESAGQPRLHHGLWKAGVALFSAAWLWSLVTSLSLLRQARRATPTGRTPPRIGVPPAQGSQKR